MDKTLWIVGQIRPEQHSQLFEFQGVFSSKELAIAACRSQTYFVAPTMLDVEIPDEQSAWPGCEYPLKEHVSA